MCIASASGYDVYIIGQTTFFNMYGILKTLKEVNALFCKKEGDEVLIDMDSPKFLLCHLFLKLQNNVQNLYCVTEKNGSQRFQIKLKILGNCQFGK